MYNNVYSITGSRCMKGCVLKSMKGYSDGLIQDYISMSSVLKMEVLHACSEPSTL